MLHARCSCPQIIAKNLKKYAISSLTSLFRSQSQISSLHWKNNRAERMMKSACPCANCVCHAGRTLLTSILYVVLIKLAIQALMSNFTPTTGIKHKTPDILDHVGPPRQLYSLNFFRKCKLGQGSQGTRQLDVWFVCACVCVCVYMSEWEGEIDKWGVVACKYEPICVCVCVCVSDSIKAWTGLRL